MDKTIQTLLNGYQLPAVLSKAEDRSIVYLNNAAQKKLGISNHQASETTLHDLFSSRRIIRQDVIWERQETRFEIHEEKLKINETEYIRSIIKPISSNKVVDLVEMQKEMAKLLVHRFHSPLNGVTGFMELLKELDLTEKQTQYVNSIENGLDDFREILSSIHKLAEDVEVQFTNIDVQHFCANIMEEYSPEEKKRITINTESNLAELYSDFILLKSIITELLDNALEFSTDPHQKIELHICRDYIRITNYGTQIPESFTEKMFYPFFSNKARGIGLGLSKCVYYAHKMGYQILLSENSSVDGISFDVRMK